jgi:hypothetical protein
MKFTHTFPWKDPHQYFVQRTRIPEFPEIFLERAKIHIAMGNWDLSLEAAGERASRHPARQVAGRE